MHLHYCDGCKRMLDSEDDVRYKVRVKVSVAGNDADAEVDDDRDHLQEIQDMLECLGDLGTPPADSDGRLTLRFDLCDECLKKFLLDPLGRRVTQQLDFSKN
jgi:hypothetical protein